MQRFGLSKLAVLVAGVFAVGLAQAQVNERTFRIAINGAPGHPAVVGAEKWAEFKKRYFAELAASQDAVNELVGYVKKGQVTFLYSSKEPEKNNAVALNEYIGAVLK